MLWPAGTLDQRYTVTLLEPWASGVNFPVGFDATDCTKLARELGSWPASYQEASLVHRTERHPALVLAARKNHKPEQHMHCTDHKERCACLSFPGLLALCSDWFR